MVMIPCVEFMPKVKQSDSIDEKNILLIARMHKAISVIQFKIEAQLIKKYPHWKNESSITIPK